jgi:hypothetical protein
MYSVLYGTPIVHSKQYSDLEPLDGSISRKAWIPLYLGFFHGERTVSKLRDERSGETLRPFEERVSDAQGKSRRSLAATEAIAEPEAARPGMVRTSPGW